MNYLRYIIYVREVTDANGFSVALEFFCLNISSDVEVFAWLRLRS